MVATAQPQPIGQLSPAGGRRRNRRALHPLPMRKSAHRNQTSFVCFALFAISEDYERMGRESMPILAQSGFQFTNEREYYNSDHAFIAGKKAAEQVMVLREEPDTMMLTAK